MTRYTVRIAEDDGEIDTDLPGMHDIVLSVNVTCFQIELRAEEKIGKFGFTSLGIVEVHFGFIGIGITVKRNLLTGEILMDLMFS